MPQPPPTVVSALAAALRTEPGRPLVTMYDGRSGERVELSVTTFDNWVSKLANLFSVEWALHPDDVVGVEMGPHWQSMVAMVAAWTAGLAVTVEPDRPVSARVVGPDRPGDPSTADHVLASSLRPMGQPFAQPLPAGMLDWSVEVPPQPDAVLIPQPVDPGTPALVTGAGRQSHGELVERGLSAARRCGLGARGRLLTDRNAADPDGLDVALLAPLVTGSSVVLLVHPEPRQAEAVAKQEHVTCEALSGNHP